MIGSNFHDNFLFTGLIMQGTNATTSSGSFGDRKTYLGHPSGSVSLPSSLGSLGSLSLSGLSISGAVVSNMHSSTTPPMYYDQIKYSM